MSKRTIIIAVTALLLLIAAFVSLFLEKAAVNVEYQDLLNGKEPDEKPDSGPKDPEPGPDPGEND